MSSLREKTDSDTDQYVVVAKVRGRLQKSVTERFNLRKLIVMEVKEQYQVESSSLQLG
jgi:hypothetical protein